MWKYASCFYLLVLSEFQIVKARTLSSNSTANFSSNEESQYDDYDMCIWALEGCDDTLTVEEYNSLIILCDCESVLVLNVSEFEYVDKDIVSFNDLIFIVQLNTSQGLPVVCLQNGTILDSGFIYDIILYCCTFVSLTGCILVFLTFCLFQQLRTFPAKIIVNVTITVLLLLLAFNLAYDIRESVLCQAAAILLHYFSLTQFLWMTIMSFEVCYSFYLANQLIPVSAKSIRCRLFAYLSIGWGMPVIMISTCVIVNYVSSGARYGACPNILEGCWFGDFKWLVGTFIALCCLLTVVQLILVAVGIFFLIKSSKKEANQRTTKTTPFSCVTIAMFFSTNVIWIFYVIDAIVYAPWLWLLFLILVAIQSLVIFFVRY